MTPMTGTAGNGSRADVRVGGSLLPRNRLIEALNGAKSVRVVVLEAPAGYSKTTTLRLWDDADTRPFAWVRCEPRYNDPALLANTLVGALGETDIDPELHESLASPVPDLNLLLERVSEAILGLDPFVLVIDDAHLLESDAAWQVLYSIISALPEGSQVAVATRVHPGLPLGRLRARGELFEFGMNDLALTRGESRELLARLDLDLGERADEIHEKAEGWPAALYLAGLAIRQGSDARPETVKFDGGDRVVVEYFRDEFIQDMPEEEARFLMETSILEELNGSLCDAVTGRKDSLAMLNKLAAENTLVVPLDRGRERFRYHHLFREMLRSEMRLRDPDAKPGLHHRAAEWLAANGDISRATDHAISSGDFELAGAYIWLDLPDLLSRGRVATVDRWFQAIGDDRIARIPALILARTHREIAMGRGDETFYWLSVAEREIVEDLPVYGDLFSLRATIGPDGAAGMVGDGRRAAELMSPTSPFQTAVKLYVGVGLFLTENEGAWELLRETAREAAMVSAIIQALALSQLALLDMENGRIDSAHDYATRARDQVERSGLRILGAMSLVYVVLALTNAELGRTEAAAADLETASKVGEGIVDYIIWHEAELVLCRTRTLLRVGQFDQAEQELGRAEAAIERVPDSPRLSRWLEECRDELEKVRGSDGAPINLTKAELRTLQFLPSHHSFRSIGEQLYLSQNTVKTQANSLYRKLGVNSRAEAVMEGRRLGLLKGE
ncbi:MAG: LuxR C-terminal-related transcriptional regulator [Solirubrobacterales bacterium]